MSQAVAFAAGLVEQALDQPFGVAVRFSGGRFETVRERIRLYLRRFPGAPRISIIRDPDDPDGTIWLVHNWPHKE